MLNFNNNKTMKTIKYLSLTLIAGVLASCSLDKFPETSYTEHNYTDEDQSSDEQYATREDMLGQLNAMYTDLKSNIQESGYSDWLVCTEVRCDNAYAGSTSTGEIMALESNSQDPENKNVVRDWNYYLARVSKANQIITYIDAIKEKDATMTQEEHDSWKAQAYCWRAYNWFNMARLWGAIPMLDSDPPAITAENVNEVYSLYYPSRTPVEEVYDQIIEDLEYAVQYAPNTDTADKFKFTKGFAAGMLARVYAEAPRQDYDKVKTYCEQVERMNYSLLDNYGDLWGYDDTDAMRNSSESIFEVTWTRSAGNWVWMMFHRNYYVPDDSFTWAKWITPSRNLIAAYDAAGDTERKNASIIEDVCTWSSYYGKDHYMFMHKCPTNATSYILMRLGEIKLLHAEALANLGELDLARDIVNEIRHRAGIGQIPVPTSKQEMLDAVLAERRLELAFEGHRWFDLVRYGKVLDVVNGANNSSSDSFDSYVSVRRTLTQQTVLLPVPGTAMDINPNLTQNKGY